MTENGKKTGFGWEKILNPDVLVLQPSNWAQNVPWKKAGLECNNKPAALEAPTVKLRKIKKIRGLKMK